VPNQESSLALPLELGLRDIGEEAKGERAVDLPSHGAYIDGAFIEANHKSRNRWINQSIVDLLLLMSGFWGIPLSFFLFLPAGQKGLLLPLSTPIIGVWVLLVAFWRKDIAFRGMTFAKWFFFAEALIACFLFYCCAWFFWGLHRMGDASPLNRIVQIMGFPLAIGVIAAFPAFFEEVAFRGLILGRLSALFGGTLGAWVAGLAFAFAHGSSIAFPLLLAIGVYLGFLRLRSGSLLPGMILHFFYNALLVFTDMS
jgi:membrane protease YdiL (CAAX protease family)